MMPSDPRTRDPLLDALQAEAARPFLEVSPEALQAALYDCEGRIAQAERMPVRSAKADGRFSSRALLHGAIAAVAVLIALAAPVAWREMMSQRQTAVTREYATHRGQQAKITLPDGSEVVLSPETRLQYTASANAGRRVTLLGQAYFTVAATPERPFIVQSGTVTTRVLGTAFAIRAYPTDAITQVAVTEGKVAIGGEQLTTVLLPGDVARVVSGHAPTVVRDAKMADVLGWMHGRLIFEDVAFRDVLVEIARVYDLEFQLPDTKLGDRPVTATFAGESGTTVVERLAIAVDASYVWDGRRIVWSLKP